MKIPQTTKIYPRTKSRSRFPNLWRQTGVRLTTTVLPIADNQNQYSREMVVVRVGYINLMFSQKWHAECHPLSETKLICGELSLRQTPGEFSGAPFHVSEVFCVWSEWFVMRNEKSKRLFRIHAFDPHFEPHSLFQESAPIPHVTQKCHDLISHVSEFFAR